MTTTDVPQQSPSRRYKAGEKVIYIAPFNNPGHWKPNDKVTGTVVNVFESSIQPSTYTIELDMVWNDRLPQSKGKKIIAGNIGGNSLLPVRG